MATQHQFEAHSLSSLAKRVLLSRKTLADHIRAGKIQPLPGSHNRSLLFSCEYLDALRQEAICVFSSRLDTLGLSNDERQRVVYASVKLCERGIDQENAEAAKAGQL